VPGTGDHVALSVAPFAPKPLSVPLWYQIRSDSLLPVPNVLPTIEAIDGTEAKLTPVSSLRAAGCSQGLSGSLTYELPLNENAFPTMPLEYAAVPVNVPLFVPMPSFVFPSARHQLTMPLGGVSHAPVSYWKPDLNVPEPPGFVAVTSTSPIGPVPVITVIVVAVWALMVAAAAANVMLLTLSRPVPLMVPFVPPVDGPSTGDTAVIVGGAGAGAEPPVDVLVQAGAKWAATGVDGARLRALFAALAPHASFVAAPDGEIASEPIVRTLMTLAEAFDLRVVAEGVESQRQRDMRRQAGCRYEQGYYYSRGI